MFEVVQSSMIVPNLHLLELRAPEVIREMKPGQFVIVRPDDDGERVPLSVCDWDQDKGTVTVIAMNVGRSTGKLAALETGMSVPTVVGPLGKPSEIDNFGTVVCLGGCYGIGSIYPIARALKEKGNRVITMIEARSAYLFYWEEKLNQVSDEMIRITRDGTKGYRGHIRLLPSILEEKNIKPDRVIVNGCTLCLKKASDATGPLEIPTMVNLNPIMIDGTGMCGVCRLTVGNKTKFACVDGPDFDGHQVNWDEVKMRRKQYLDEEADIVQESRCEDHSRRD
jgi:ferredoxin--NADP+ reductase